MPLPADFDLTQFTGTEEYHRWSPLFRNVIASDGAMYVAEQCGAYWLLDVIGSHMPQVPKTEAFCVAILGKDAAYDGGGWTFRLVDDVPSNKIYATQKIEFSDFPLDEIKFYVEEAWMNGLRHWLILLPTEH